MLKWIVVGVLVWLSLPLIGWAILFASISLGIG